MQIIKRAAASLGFVLVLGVILSGVSFTFERKESTERYSKFWENPQEYDVWFIGNSHVYYAINPMELWNQRICNLTGNPCGLLFILRTK